MMMPSDRAKFWEHYEVVIFDADDTLTMSMKVRIKAILHIANELHIELNEKKIRSVWGKPFDEFVRLLFPGIELETYLRHFNQIHEQYQAVANPGVQELIEYLMAQKKHLEIVTSSKQEIILKDLTTIGIRDHFVEVWGHEQTAPYGKPDPRVLYPMLNKLSAENFRIEQMLYIGDSISDYLVAKGNGIEFIAVTTGLDAKQSFLKAGLPRTNIKRSLNALVPRTIQGTFRRACSQLNTMPSKH